MATLEEEVESAAMQLPRSSRARLAEKLLGSLDEEDEIEAAWNEEIERRVREIDSGQVKLIPGRQAMAELRARIRR
ncbi:MAG TPA: addiction module protein [Longimicrobium sp.]|nr:addiction module protein [Longimicrobium sp.]